MRRPWMDEKRAAEREGIEAEAITLADAHRRHEPKGSRMGDENQNLGNQHSSDGALAEAERDADLNRRINAAVASQVKRAAKPLMDEIASLHALLQKAPADGTPNGSGGVSEAARLAEENAQLRREAAEQKQARVREETTHKLMTALEQRGVKAEYRDAVIALLRARGDLVEGDDGAARFAVTRVRKEKGEPERIDHDDIRLAVEDWARTDEARAYLRAPVPGGRRAGAPNVRPPMSPRTPRSATDLDGQLRDALNQLNPATRASLTGRNHDDREITKTLEDLEQRGIDINAL